MKDLNINLEHLVCCRYSINLMSSMKFLKLFTFLTAGFLIFSCVTPQKKETGEKETVPLEKLPPYESIGFYIQSGNPEKALKAF